MQAFRSSIRTPTLRRLVLAAAALLGAAPAAAQPATTPAMENPYVGAPKRSEVAEAKRLVKAGKELQAANARRRDAEKQANAKAVSDLVPRYLKAAPAGWSVNELGFVFDIVRPDGAQICNAIDAMRRGETFFCSAEDRGARHRLVVPF